MAKKKVNDTRANIESGMYFKFKEDKHRSYTNKVYQVEINNKGYMTLMQYHCQQLNIALFHYLFYSNALMQYCIIIF